MISYIAVISLVVVCVTAVCFALTLFFVTVGNCVTEDILYASDWVTRLVCIIIITIGVLFTVSLDTIIIYDAVIPRYVQISVLNADGEVLYTTKGKYIINDSNKDELIYYDEARLAHSIDRVHNTVLVENVDKEVDKELINGN